MHDHQTNHHIPEETLHDAQPLTMEEMHQFANLPEVEELRKQSIQALLDELNENVGTDQEVNVFSRALPSHQFIIEENKPLTLDLHVLIFPTGNKAIVEHNFLLVREKDAKPSTGYLAMQEYF